jgi:hypothetical protein
MENRRTALSLLLLAAGVVLLVCGLLSRSPVLSSGEEGQKVTALSEASITQEVARGGVTRDESGQIKKTYEEGQQAPTACPT